MFYTVYTTWTGEVVLGSFFGKTAREERGYARQTAKDIHYVGRDYAKAQVVAAKHRKILAK